MLVAASCELLRLTASYLSPTFVTIVLLLPASLGHFLLLTDIFSGCMYFMDRGSMDQGRVDHGLQSFGVNGNSGSNGNMTHRECT